MASLAKGENHWAWDAREDQWYRLIPGEEERRRIFVSSDPRMASDSSYPVVLDRTDLKTAVQSYTVSCYKRDDGKVMLYVTIADGNVFFFP
ncbi:hypothetical protein N7453_006100 [Penicillium expansum]|nr:hypothetical protein N7453_006100 [Penicillium expansum]